MFQAKQVQKFLASSLILIMVLGNPVVSMAQAVSMTEQTAVSREQAATPDTAEKTDDATTFKVDKSQALQATQATIEEDIGRKSKTTGKDKTFQFGNRLISYYLQHGKAQGPAWLKTTSFNFYVSEDFKPMYSFETIQPVGERNNNPGVHWFWQGRYAHSGDDSTANLGVGWRKLSPDKHSLVGMNFFYDYGFQYDLARIGLGGEYFNNLNEYRFNIYHPLTGDKRTDVSYSDNGILYSYIRAVDGMDFEMGTSFAHAQWLKAFVKGYYYDNKHNDDETGYQVRTTMQLAPRFKLELGYRHSNLTREPYAEFKYQLADTMTPALKEKAKNSNSYDLSDKILQLVERDNDIKTETWTKFVSYTGNIKAKVTNTYNNTNTPLAGALVQAYQNGTAVGAPATTDANGEATISGLNVGTYRLGVTYFNDSGTSASAVVVQKDQTAQADVGMSVENGTAVVNVLDANSQPVSGASVTAQRVDTQTAMAEKNIFDSILGVSTAYAAAGNFTLTMTTGADGRAAFENLPSGTYRFTVTYNGQIIAGSSLTVRGDDNSAYVVLPSTAGSNTGSAAITVTDGVNAITNATVSVLVNGTTKSLKTNAQGVVIFNDLSVGTYNFTIEKENYVKQSQTLAVSAGVTANDSVCLISQTGAVTITLSGTMAIADYTITVTDSTGATHTGTVDSGNTTTTISNIPTGNCTVAVAAPSGYVATITPSSFTLAASGSQAVSVVSFSQGTGQATGSVNVTLSGTMAIADYTITVADNTGATHTGTVNRGHTTTTISNIPTGNCMVAVIVPSGYTATITPYSFTLGASGSQAVAVASTSQGSGTVQVTLSGVVATDNYMVTITDSAGNTHTRTVNRYQQMTDIMIPAGSYSVAVTPPSGYTTTPTSASGTMTAGGSQAVAVASTSQGSGIVQITLSGAMATDNYTVTITDSAGNTHTGTVNSGHTTTMIDGIPAGNCTVTVTVPSGYMATITPSSFILRAAGSLTVTGISSTI